MSFVDIEIIKNILCGVINANALIRNRAVEKINELRRDIPSMCSALAQILTIDSTDGPENKLAKTVAIVLLRQILDIPADELISNPWLHCDENIKQQIKSITIKALLNEREKSLKLKIGNVIIQIAINSLESQESWEELFVLIYHTLNLDPEIEENEIDIECVLYIMAGVVGFIYDSLQSQMEFVLSRLRLFLKMKSSFMDLKIRALRLISEMMTFSDNKEIKFFREFIFPTLETCYKCFETGEIQEYNLRTSLHLITEMCVHDPTPWKQNFHDLFSLMSLIIDKKTYTNEKIREMGFEVIVSLVERKYDLFLTNQDLLQQFINKLYSYAMETNSIVTDDWANPNSNTYEDEDLIYEEQISTTYSFLDRLIEKLNIDFMLPKISELVNQLLVNTESRYIGLITISHVLCFVEDMTTVESSFHYIFSFVNFPSCGKVRYGALSCINEMSQRFEPYFQEKYKDIVLPMIIDLLKNESILRVKLEILNTLYSFISKSSKDILQNYTHQLLEIMFSMFVLDIPTILRNEILGTLSAIVNVLEESFRPYSETSFQIIWEYFIHVYSNKINNSLYGGLIECITLIGPMTEQAYDSVFLNVMKCIIEITNGICVGADANRGYIQEAMGRVIPIIRTKYPDVLPELVTLILNLIRTLHEQCVSLDSSTQVQIDDEFESQNLSDEEEKDTINTSATEELTQCIELLKTLVESVGSSFLPYINITEKELFPFLNYSLNADIRKQACTVLPILMNLISANAQEFASLHGKLYISQLMSTIIKEHKYAIVAIQMESLGNVIKNAGTILNKDEVNKLFGQLIRYLKVCEKKREILLKTKNTNSHISEEYDSDDDVWDEVNNIIEENLEELEKIHLQVADVIGYLIQSHKSISEDIVNSILSEYLPKYLRPEASDFEIQMGIFLVDNLVEFVGYAYLKGIWSNLGQIMTGLSNHRHPQIRQAACYGIGLFAKFTCENFEQYANTCLSALKVALMHSKDSTAIGCKLARDNAVAAVGKIIKYQHECQSIKDNLSSIISLWVSNLPITSDSSEWDEQHQLLCEMILNQTQLIMGEGMENMREIVHILAKIYETKCACSQVNAKIIHIFQLIKGNDYLRTKLEEVYLTSESAIQYKLNKLNRT